MRQERTLSISMPLILVTVLDRNRTPFYAAWFESAANVLLTRIHLLRSSSFRNMSSRTSCGSSIEVVGSVVRDIVIPSVCIVAPGGVVYDRQKTILDLLCVV